MQYPGITIGISFNFCSINICMIKINLINIKNISIDFCKNLFNRFVMNLPLQLNRFSTTLMHISLMLIRLILIIHTLMEQKLKLMPIVIPGYGKNHVQRTGIRFLKRFLSLLMKLTKKLYPS